MIIRNYKPLFVVLYLSFMGLACVMAASVYLGIPPSPIVGLTFMGFVFFIYVINRYTDLQEDFANDVEKVVFFTNRLGLMKLAIGALVLAVICLAALDKLSLFHVVLMGVGIGYSYRMIPWYKQGRGLVFYRIKEMPLVKNLAVSVLWGLAVFVIPMAFSGIQTGHPYMVGVIVAAIIISTFNNTLFDDITDVVGDRISETATLPTLFGERASYNFLWWLNSLWLLFLAGSFGWGLLDGYHFTFLMVVALYPLSYIMAYKQKWLKKGMVDILMELDLLIIAGGLALLSLAPRFFG